MHERAWIFLRSPFADRDLGRHIDEDTYTTRYIELCITLGIPLRRRNWHLNLSQSRRSSYISDNRQRMDSLKPPRNPRMLRAPGRVKEEAKRALNYADDKQVGQGESLPDQILAVAQMSV